ncbi:MAG TPA: diguanylate cyclase [Candidatus Limnocylindrales bacterium]
MTDYQILTIIAAFIIVDIAVLSLVAIPLLRRRLASRIDNGAPAAPATQPPPVLPADPLAAVSAGRLAAGIGSRPTLSAAIPTLGREGEGVIDLDDLPIGTAFAETDENETSQTPASDVIDAIAAVRTATDAPEHPASVSIDSDDVQDEAQNMDSTEMSVARARGFAIHPEDPLVAATIDRLLGARRDVAVTTTAPDANGTAEGADAAEGAAAAETAEAAERSTATDASGTIATADASTSTDASGVTSVHVSADVRVPAETESPAETDTTAETTEGTATGRPVMAARGSRAVAFPEPTIDAATGLDGPLSWAMAITIEEARSGRYGRPVSVVIAELDGLERLSELFGADVADRLIPPVGDALRRSARAADRVARLSHTRFGVLLVETDEIRAINYVERVRSACDGWLEASAISLRLSIGWASPATDGDLRSAVRIAEDRMHREQHRPAPWRQAVAATPGTTATSGTTATPEG